MIILFRKYAFIKSSILSQGIKFFILYSTNSISSIYTVSYFENESDDDFISTSRHEFRAIAAVSAGFWTIRATGRSALNRHSSTVHPGGYCESWQMGSVVGVRSRSRDCRELHTTPYHIFELMTHLYPAVDRGHLTGHPLRSLLETPYPRLLQ